MSDNNQQLNTMFESASNESEESLANIERQRKQQMKIINKALESTEKFSIENFSSWREYLHRYFSIVFILIGATGFIQNENFIFIWFKIGLFTALIGVFIGYITINIYFYIERRWFQMQNFMSMDYTHERFEHPDRKTSDFKESLRLYNDDIIKKLTKELKEAKNTKNKKQITYIEFLIKRNKKLGFSIKFIGQHFEVIEKIWIYGVVLSMTLTFIGIILMYANIVK